MRNIGIISTYNRVIIHRKLTSDPDTKEALELKDSLLGFFGAGESKLISSFVKWSEGDATTYGQRPGVHQ
jgi:hypothetical protein